MKTSVLMQTFMLDQEIWKKAYTKAHVKDLNKGMLDKYRAPSERIKLMESIIDGTFQLSTPHEAAIPKPDSKEKRIVVIAGKRDCPDRLVLTIMNDVFMKVVGPYLISERSKAYQEGLSCGKTVKELPEHLCKKDGNIVVKIDFTKYFDRISREVVFAILDLVEMIVGFENGTEPIINFLRKMFSDDRIIDINKQTIEKWSGIRQGNPISAFLANVVLKELDDFMSEKYPYYVRYSDDLICIGKSEKEIINDIESIIAKYSVSMNPNKTDVYTKDEWFKFLGFNCKRNLRSLSARRIKDIQKRILEVTVDLMPNITYEKACDNTMNLLYGYGNGDYSWATSVLPVVNCRKDIEELDGWIRDVLRVVRDGRRRPHKNNHGSYNALGSIGCDMKRKDYTFVRYNGSWISPLRKQNPAPLENYYSLVEAWKEINMSKDLFECSVRTRKL